MVILLIRRIAVALVSSAMIFVVVVPLALYWLGLSNIDGRPQPVVSCNTAAKTELLQKSFRSSQPAVVHVLNPWTFVFSFGSSGIRDDVGAAAVWVIARSYNSGHLDNRKMIWWHLSGAALTIWLTRNWTTDQIVCSAAAIASSWSRRG